MLDHAFTDLERDDGRARARRARGPGAAADALILWVGRDLPATCMLFTGDPLPDVARRSLAVEPMTCPPNAFRTGEALLVLEPGESYTRDVGHRPGLERRQEVMT